MKLFYRVLLVLFCFSAESIQAQMAIADSLKTLLPTAKEDTNKVLILCNLAFYLYEGAPEESLGYSTEALELAEGLDFTKGIANAYYKKALAHSSLGDFDLAIEELDSSLDISLKNNLKKQARSSYNVLGIMHRYRGNTDLALDYTSKSAEMSLELNDSVDVAIAYNNIGSIYLDKQDNAKARKYYLVALEINEKIGMERNILETLTNLGLIEPDSTKKLEYILRSIEMGKEQESIYNLSFAFTNYGKFLNETRNQPKISLPEYYKALAYAQEANNYFLLTNIHHEIGLVFDKIGLTDSVLFHLQKSLELAKNQDMKEHIMKAHQFLGGFYAKQGNYRAAYISQKKGKELSDSLYSKNIASSLAYADAKFQTSKKEAQLTAQKLQIAQHKNQQNQLLIGGLLLLALTAGVFQYFFYRQKQKKQQVELALKAELMEAERLRNLDELKTQFFTNVSHELRTPLTLIISPLEEVLKKLKQVNLEADLQLALRNSKNLLGLVNEVLDLSKLEDGKLAIKKTEILVSPFLRRVFSSFQSAADLKNVALETRLDLPENLTLKTDVPKLEKIFNNLISNALKFTPTSGKIQLTGILTSKIFQGDALGELNLTISDTGPGIHPKDLPHLFDRFFQSKKNSDGSAGGTGIGLALAKQLSNLMGGELKVNSELGEGSHFTLVLPAEFDGKNLPTGAAPATSAIASPFFENEMAENGEGVSAYEPVFINGQKPRLLIVEDNLEMGDYLKNNLSKNYHCTVAMDGSAALQLLETEKFDLITSDVMMPNMDGFTLRKKINEHSEWQRIPFILLTARTLEADKLKGFQLGIDDYVTKPFSLPELAARVHNLLSNKRVRDEIREEDLASSPNLSTAEPGGQLLQAAENLVLEKMDDPQFTVEVLAQNLGYSQRQLARVFGKLTGLTPVKFVLELRLQKARQLLESRQFASVTEVRYEVGIESASYFTKKFTERFGKNPSAYLEEVG